MEQCKKLLMAAKILKEILKDNKDYNKDNRQ